MTKKAQKVETPQPPVALTRFTKALLAVPAQEIAEQKAKYEREKQLRRRGREERQK